MTTERKRSKSAADPYGEAVALAPAQRRALEQAAHALTVSPLVHLWSRAGLGRTTVLRRLARQTKGRLLAPADFFDATASKHPLQLEEAIFERLRAALNENETVLVDDWHLLTAAMHSCQFYPRRGYLDAPVAAITALAESSGRQLVLATNGRVEDPFSERAGVAGLDHFTPEDYAVLLRAFSAGAADGKVDAAKLHRFAPKLTAHQLRSACAWLAGSKPSVPVETEALIEYFRRMRLTSNVELSEVRKVELRDLRGMDDVIEALEAHVVLPLENDALAQELMLQPRRGILLAGPPGTGKTTIGRALAHRLRGKFFLLDGTVVSGTPQFFSRVAQIFAAASENAPSVIFIDDSDVIFESGSEHGLYRYLLTMLDGLEGESGKTVCVVMTAMDVGNLPPALVRSGRISLWLETRLPDASAREAILAAILAKGPPALRDVEMSTLVGATDGFSGADLERVVEDTKSLVAYDRARERPAVGTTAQMLRAVEEVRRNHERYARAEAAARAHRPQRPPWFGVAGFAGPRDDGDDVPAMP